MEVFKVVFVFIYFLVFYGESNVQECSNELISKSAANRLTNDLFCSYNRNVRPVINQSTQTNITTSLYIFHVHMDDKWDNLQLSIQLIMSWKDEFLVWDPSKYDNINTMHTESNNLWLPDIMSYDIGFLGDISEYSYFLPSSIVKINSNGVVKYNHRVILTGQCSANLAKWPFDSHNCTYLLGSPTYNNLYVNYIFPNGFYNLDYYNPGKEWELLDVSHQCMDIYYTNANSTHGHCILQYNINIKRFSSMYFSSIIIPAIVLSLMRTFTFFMGREMSLRIFLLCLFFISELLYLIFINFIISNNGENSIHVVLLYRNSLILTAMTIIISVINNEFYKLGTEDFPRKSPEWLKSVTTLLLNKRPINFLTNFNTQGAELLIENNIQEDSDLNKQRNEDALFWKTLSILLDRVSFVVILMISLINFIFLTP